MTGTPLPGKTGWHTMGRSRTRRRSPTNAPGPFARLYLPFPKTFDGPFSSSNTRICRMRRCEAVIDKGGE